LNLTLIIPFVKEPLKRASLAYNIHARADAFQDAAAHEKGLNNCKDKNSY
jgi:hypothetical protein